jgi:chromosome segregation ATPase
MKKVAVSLFVLLLAIPAFSQGKAAQIAALQTELSQIQASYPVMEQKLKDFDVQKDNIKFAVDAYTKYNDQYKTDIANFNQKQDEVNRQQQLLQPSIDNYKQRLAQHNANQCTEVRGSGTCNWYNNEANQLDANKAQILQVQNQIDAQQGALEPQRSNLRETLSKLETIWQNNQTNIANWKAGMIQLKSDYEAAAARETQIKQQIAILQGDVNSCLKAIPPACQTPAIDPTTGKPILDQNCENMKAVCSKMFDGN